MKSNLTISDGAEMVIKILTFPIWFPFAVISFAIIYCMGIFAAIWSDVFNQD